MLGRKKYSEGASPQRGILAWIKEHPMSGGHTGWGEWEEESTWNRGLVPVVFFISEGGFTGFRKKRVETIGWNHQGRPRNWVSLEAIKFEGGNLLLGRSQRVCLIRDDHVCQEGGQFLHQLLLKWTSSSFCLKLV